MTLADLWRSALRNVLGNRCSGGCPQIELVRDLATDVFRGDVITKFHSTLSPILSDEERIAWYGNITHLYESAITLGHLDTLNEGEKCQIVEGINVVVRALLLCKKDTFSTVKISCLNHGLDSGAILENGSCRFCMRAFADEVARRGGVTRSVAEWWTDMVILLLPFHPEVLPHISVNGNVLTLKPGDNAEFAAMDR